MFDASFVMQGPNNYRQFYYKTQNDYSSFIEDMQKQIENNITLLSKFFTIKDNIVILTDESVLEFYVAVINTLKTKFKDNQDALKILSKYTNTNIFTISQDGFFLYKTFMIDKDNICGLADILSCGLPQI